MDSSIALGEMYGTKSFGFAVSKPGNIGTVDELEDICRVPANIGGVCDWEMTIDWLDISKRPAEDIDIAIEELSFNIMAEGVGNSAE